MGTTMHAHIEVKKDGKWYHYGCPDVDRDYLVFACINGTRKDTFNSAPNSIKDKIKPVARIHELPKDMSEVTRICLDMDKAGYRLHDFGVLEADDLSALQKELREITGCGRYDLEADIFKTCIGGNSITRHDGFEDVRVLFWFDN